MKDEQAQSKPPIRVGRITAALLLVTVGLLLLIDQLWDTSWIRLIFTWWPLVLISWGLETIWFGIRKSERKWKLDVLGMFGAVFISAIVFTAAQPNLFQDWISRIQFDFSMMKQMVLTDGLQFEQPKLAETWSPEVSSIQIHHTAGDVYVETADIEQVELSSLLTIYNSNKEQAEELADRSYVQMNKNADKGLWTIKTVGLNTIPDSNIDVRIDMQIIVPAEAAVPIDIKLDKGDIYIQDLRADVRAVTLNGDLLASDLGGKAELETRNGDIDVKRVAGEGVYLTNNGDIQVSESIGAVRMETHSGDIDLQEAYSMVTAESLNGDLSLESGVMAGDWSIQALAGDVTIRLPEDADMNVQAHLSFGDAVTTFPLDISEHTISGIIGSGSYQLNVEVNGDLKINARE